MMIRIRINPRPNQSSTSLLKSTGLLSGQRSTSTTVVKPCIQNLARAFVGLTHTPTHRDTFVVLHVVEADETARCRGIIF